MLGRHLQSFASPLGKLVKLDKGIVSPEAQEFEKHFVVYAEDENQARSILTTSLMNRLVDFKKKNRSEIRLSFTGTHIFTAIPVNCSPVTGPLFGSILNFSRLEKYLNYIELAIGIAKDVNCNTRICNLTQTGNSAAALL